MVYWFFLSDVFWYRSTRADLRQLDDEERCDIIRGPSGTCTLEMFTTVRSDRGQYLCIGVNELGRCTQSFRLTVTGRYTFTKEPAWIYDISLPISKL